MPKESHPSEPVSTRVTARQKQVVDEAAQLLKMSTAKFIREAVIEKAVAVLNASGNNNDPLRELAEKLLIPALNPMVEVVWQPQFDEMGEHVDKFRAVDWENMDPIEFQVYMDQMHDGPYGQHTVRVVRPDEDEKIAIRRALESCGSEFVRVILGEWDRVLELNRCFIPKYSASDLLKDGEEDES